MTDTLTVEMTYDTTPAAARAGHPGVVGDGAVLHDERPSRRDRPSPHPPGLLPSGGADRADRPHQSGYLLFDEAELATLREIVARRRDGAGIREIRQQLGR